MKSLKKLKDIIKLLLLDFLDEKIDNLRQDLKQDVLNSNSQILQRIISQNYQHLWHSGYKIPKFKDTGFRVYSQNDEDGYLLYIFSLIGTTNRKTVEICAGNGIQCNTANLIINHGWSGLLFDGSEENIINGRKFYASCKDTLIWPPALVHAWITAENINQLILDNGFSGNIDLLSLDIDGVDYWIWKAIDCISPRVVVVEYQDIWGPEKSVTIPYQPNFAADFGEYGPDYCGASLAAFVKLGREKGYRLVGCNNYGFNAFFIRNDVGIEIFPEIQPFQCFTHPKVEHGIKYRLPNISDKPWIEVE